MAKGIHAMDECLWFFPQGGSDSVSPASSGSTDDPDATDDADGADGGEEPDADPGAKALKSREARLGIPTGVLLH